MNSTPDFQSLVAEGNQIYYGFAHYDEHRRYPPDGNTGAMRRTKEQTAYMTGEIAWNGERLYEIIDAWFRPIVPEDGLPVDTIVRQERRLSLRLNNKRVHYQLPNAVRAFYNQFG